MKNDSQRIIDHFEPTEMKKVPEREHNKAEEKESKPSLLVLILIMAAVEG